MTVKARSYELDCVLGLQLAGADREFSARIAYRSAPFMVAIDRVEIQVADGQWIAAPLVHDLVQDSPSLFDALRRHAGG